jgi:hypothetical protein
MLAFLQLKLCRVQADGQMIENALKHIKCLNDILSSRDKEVACHSVVIQFELLCRQKNWEQAMDLIQKMKSLLNVDLWKNVIGIFVHVDLPQELVIATLDVKTFL